MHTRKCGQNAAAYATESQKNAAFPTTSTNSARIRNTPRLVRLRYAVSGILSSQNSKSFQACYRTFFPMPLAVGCQNDNNALPRLCCESHFRPYQGRTFTALRLAAPTTVAVLNYSAFSWTPNGWWNVREPQVYSVMLDGSEQRLYLDSSSNIEFSTAAPSSSANQLESGMYFVENFAPGQYSQLFRQPLNDKWEQR